MLPFDVRHRHPTLLNSCAMAATAAEARFRVDYPNASAQASRVIALDRGAVPVVCRLARQEWAGAHFLGYHSVITVDGHGSPTDAMLRGCDGSPARLSDELGEADLVVMVATADDGATAASVIGRQCAERGIMTTGVVFAEWGALDEAVSSLRPYAMVLVSSTDEDDVRGILNALRA